MRTLLIALLMALAAQSSNAQDFDKGYKALESEDFETALRELKPLAEEGHEVSLILISGMYRLGFGVEQSNIDGYMWAGVAAALESISGKKVLEDLSKIMTEDQISEAKNLITEFLYKKCKEAKNSVC